MTRIRIGLFGVFVAFRLSRRRFAFSIQATRPWLITGCIFGLFVGYVIGAVPTAALLERAFGPSPFLEAFLRTIYAPVVYAYENISIMHAFIDWQSSLFNNR